MCGCLSQFLVGRSLAKRGKEERVGKAAALRKKRQVQRKQFFFEKKNQKTFACFGK
jgi:hypothetical protein